MKQEYPKLLIPTEEESFSLEGKIIKIPKCIVKFNKWNGEPIEDTFGGKPVICIDDKPMFAELAIMEYFIKSDWESRWVETYARLNLKPKILSSWKDGKYRNQVEDPILNDNIWYILEGIASCNNKSYSGCWDVIGWKGNQIIFAESKRNKKDKIRQTQNNWLSAGLKFGLKPENFLIVQWDME